MQIFLETTALIELAFWDAVVRKKILAIWPQGSAVITSDFVIFEVARGFLANLILLHNKSYQVSTFSELQAYAGRSRLAPHRLGTIIGAFEAFFRSDDAYPATSDKDLLAKFRGHLRRKIRRGWNKVLNVADTILNSVGCRSRIDAPKCRDDGLYEQDLKKDLCGKARCCGLKGFYRDHRAAFEKLRISLQSLPTADLETKNRIRSLKKLYRNPAVDFEKTDCYRSGDATIAQECPEEFTILTKNERHFVPIVKDLGREALYYS